MKKTRLHYIVSTHWDREWYSSFQDFRYRLVRLMDRAIAGLESGRLKGPFTLDGQVVPIEDYLEIRPERRTQVEQLIRERKIIIGPWYVMPDEFTVPGESLIRNLRLGADMAHAYGTEPSKGGFVCDIFGHNSQMPQIFRGFGIRGAFLWRGTNQIMHRNLIWEGADGTRIPVYRFGKIGYCSFAFFGRFPFRTQGDFGGFSGWDREKGIQSLEEFVQFCRDTNDIDTILLFDGCDHQEWDEEVYEVLLEKFGEDSEFHFVHGTFDDYLDELEAQVDKIGTVLSGELREPGLENSERDQQWLIPGVLSSRVWHKQANWEAENRLTRWAEPFAAFANAALGREYPTGFLNVAWKWLIENHPHDSIDGCSIDQVHRDMMYRFDQARGIAERLTLEATQAFSASVAGEIGEKELRVNVFNPHPRDFTGVADLTLTFPNTWATFQEFFGFEPKPAFRIYGADGSEIAYQRLGQRLEAPIRAQQRVRQQSVRVALQLQVPALGYTTLAVKEAPGEFTRHPAVPGLATSDRTMENESIAIYIENDGTLSLLDKESGRMSYDLLTFEDIADIGDGWYHGAAANDEVFTSAGSEVEIARLADTPLMTTFRVRRWLSLPKVFDYSAMARSPERVKVQVDTLVTLRAGQHFVELEHCIENTAGDHRLRVLFPSGAARADTYLADSHFDVVERPIALRADNHRYRELEVDAKPQLSWTAVYDKKGGLAVVSAGQLESAVLDQPERPIAVTLFRSTRRTVNTEGEPDGLLLGKVRVKQYVVPLNGKPDRVALSELGQRQTAGLRMVQSTGIQVAALRAQREVSAEAALPPQDGFFRLEGKAVLSSAGIVNGALEVRLWNPAGKPHAAALVFGDAARYTTGWQVNLLSEPLSEPQPLYDGVFEVALAPKQIVTLRFA
ncbi:MAG: glycoside hydrolase family 38 [Anaerolineae bacterium]|nr:glycoside hydrolase family 38 [Anaerolineae bacterium]